jgi:hypothetical protein
MKKRKQIADFNWIVNEGILRDRHASIMPEIHFLLENKLFRLIWPTLGRAIRECIMEN